MNYDIVLRDFNASYCEVEAEFAILGEIYDLFTFYAPNYKFIKSYKNGLWDGKIHLFDIEKRRLPYGLVNILSKYARNSNLSLLDTRVSIFEKKPTEAEIELFLDDLKVTSNGKEISYYDHQKKAINLVLRSNRCTILSSTSSGKSLIIYSIIRWYEQYVNGKILLIVPNVSLVHQMFSDFEDYSSKDTWDVAIKVHKIHASQPKHTDKSIVISTWQSIQKEGYDYYSQFDVILCDEVHKAEAKILSGILNKCVNAYVRAGFTGTLKSKKIHEYNINALFGKVERVSTNKELVDKDIITPLNIQFIILKYNKTISKEINRRVVESIDAFGKKKYRDNYRNECDYIISCQERNKFIMNLVHVLDKNTLILFDKVEKHGIPLYEAIKAREKNRNVYYISGKTKGEERERIRKQMEHEKDAILVASYGTLSTGVNIKNLHNVIFAYPFKSDIVVLQSIGRLLRKMDGKKMAVLFDIVDDFRYKKYKNYLYKHFIERYNLYLNEQFPIKISEYQLC